MRLFILIQFWLAVAVFIIRIIELMTRTWPHKREPKTLAWHLADTIIGLGIIFWAGIVLWVVRQ